MILLEFEFSNYTFSEDTFISDAEIAVVIANYDDLVINSIVDVTVITQPTDSSNATEHNGNGMFLHCSQGYTFAIYLSIDVLS